MKVCSLSLENYRNIKKMDLVFEDGVNIIYGDNAQGKTNIIEAISLCNQKKSFRTNHDVDLINFDEKTAKVEMTYQSKKRVNKAVLTLERDRIKAAGAKRTSYINDLKLKDGLALTEDFTRVIFAPSHLSLIKEGPDLRRKFLDECITEISPKYREALLQFNRVLFQRNAFLKNFEAQKIMDSWQIRAFLNSWNELMAKYGAFIHFMRQKYLKEFLKHAKEIYKGFAGENEVLDVKYHSTMFSNDLLDCEDVKKLQKIYEDTLLADCEDDLKANVTQKGVQRDDIEILISGSPARAFASQGQQRSAVLAFKLAQCQILYNAMDEYPVIILDDVLSELDNSRKEFILNKFKDTQVIITACALTDEELSLGGKHFHIKDGGLI